jgi:hypothetical protein
LALDEQAVDTVSAGPSSASACCTKAVTACGVFSVGWRSAAGKPPWPSSCAVGRFRHRDGRRRGAQHQPHARRAMALARRATASMKPSACRPSQASRVARLSQAAQ